MKFIKKVKIFNIGRYSELLRKSKILKNDKKFLFHENQEEYMELLCYQEMISDWYFYQHRFEYYALIKNFLDLKIEQNIFISKFLNLYNENRKALKLLLEDFERLRTSSINANSKRFSVVIDGIYEYWDNLDIHCDFEKSDVILEDEFKQYIKNILIDMQPYI